MLAQIIISGVKNRDITNVFEYKTFSFFDFLFQFIEKLKETFNFIKRVERFAFTGMS